MFNIQNTNTNNYKIQNRIQSGDVKNVNIGDVQITKGGKLTTPLGSCVAFAGVKGNIGFMGHVFKDKDVPNMINKTRNELKKRGYDLDDFIIFIAGGACSDLFVNSKFRPGNENVRAVQQGFGNKVRQICVGGEESRFVTLDVNNSEFIVEKIKKGGSGRYLSKKCKMH